MFLAFFTALSLLAFLRAYRDRQTPGGPWLWTMYIASGLAFLSKGPLGAILPAIAIGAYLAATRQWRGFIAIKPIRGILLFLLVASPWYLYMYNLHGGQFLHEHFIGRNLERYFTNRWEHAGPPWYYLPVLIAGTFPWTIAFVAGVVSSVRKALTNTDCADEQKFLLCWLIGMLLFFSFSRSKLPNYVLPLYPAALIISARLIHNLAESNARKLGAALAWGTSAAAAVLVVIGAMLLSRKLGEPAGVILLWLSPLALAAVSAALVHFRRTGIRAWTWSCALSMALFFAVLTGVAIPRVERLQAVRLLAADCREQLPPGARVAAWRVWNPSLLFYTGAGVYRFNPETETWPPQGAEKIEWVLTRSNSIEEVVQRTGRRLSEVYERDRYVLLRLAPD